MSLSIPLRKAITLPHRLHSVPEPITIFMSCMIVGGTWYLIAIQSLIARTIRMFQLSTSVFEKSLEGFNQNEQFKPSTPAPQENTANDQQKS